MTLSINVAEKQTSSEWSQSHVSPFFRERHYEKRDGSITVVITLPDDRNMQTRNTRGLTFSVRALMVPQFKRRATG